MLSELQILCAARDWLTDERNWTRGHARQVSEGRVSACAQQAPLLVSQQTDRRYLPAAAALRRLQAAAVKLGYVSVPALNDSGGYMLVLDMYQAAIDAARVEQHLRLALRSRPRALVVQ